MIKLGRTGYWFTGERFFFGDREKQRDLTDEDREPLLRYLCSCAFGLNRWQGEANEQGDRWSVGEHSILVSALAGRLAILRGLDADDVAIAVRLGAIHDLGETLGLGDIAAPWLRGGHDGDVVRMMLRRECHRHQRCASALAGLHLPDIVGSSLTDDVIAGEDAARLGDVIVKDADHLAAALERRYFFGDTSGDMEHPDAPRLFDEMFEVATDADEAPLVDSDADWTLLDLIQGVPRGDVYVFGEPLIRNGKAVGP